MVNGTSAAGPPALADLVPYITRWSAERPARTTVIQRRHGIGYPYEKPRDRDRRGVLWLRIPSRQGEGRPEFGRVHSGRQRRAMTRLLCQVCGGPADRGGDGVLWLIGEDQDAPDSWPDPLITPHPPVCAPCARRSVLACPHLRRNRALLRVHAWELIGVRGTLYWPARPNPVPADVAGIAFTDPRVRWTQAGQLIARLTRFTPLDLQ